MGSNQPDYCQKAQIPIVETTHTATCNGAAYSLLPELVRKDPVLYPPADVLYRGEWLAPQSSGSQRLRDRLWTEMKSA